MDLGLEGKAAIVTGASYGLGYAIAKSLAEEGVNVAMCSRHEDRISTAAAEIAEKTGVKTIGIACDLINEEQIKEFYKQAEKTMGPIDILVVNTGHPPTHPFSVATDADWKTGVDMVLKPSMVLIRLVLASMQRRKYGRIILIGSIFGHEPEQSSVVQSTIRAGMNSMAKCIASEVAADGVTVNVICPGYFDTPLVRDLAKQYAATQNVSADEVLNYWKQYSPVKRFGKAEDLGALTAFIASPRGEFITGTAITIDGGAIRQI